MIRHYLNIGLFNFLLDRDLCLYISVEAPPFPLRLSRVSLNNDEEEEQEEERRKKKMSSNEDLVEDMVSNGDSFEKVKQRLKDRSKVHRIFAFHFVSDCFFCVPVSFP